MYGQIGNGIWLRHAARLTGGGNQNFPEFGEENRFIAESGHALPCELFPQKRYSHSKRFDVLVEPMAVSEGVTEQLKVAD